MLLVTVIGQFTAKTTNSEKAVYFLSIMSCSINKLKSRKFFTCKNFVFRFYMEKKIFCSRKWWERGGGPSAPTAPPPLCLRPWLYIRKDPDNTLEMQFEIDDFDICSTYSINFKLETSDCTMMPRQMVPSVVKFDLSNTYFPNKYFPFYWILSCWHNRTSVQVSGIGQEIDLEFFFSK